MKNWLIVCGVVCLLVALVGCRRRNVAEADVYDPNTDAPASSVVITEDPRISDDQKEISRAAKKKSRPTEAARTDAKATPPEGDATDEKAAK